MERQVILALSFGKPSTTSANKLIATLAMEEAKKVEASLVLADKCVPIEDKGEFNDKFFYILLGSDKEDEHCSTLDLLEQAVNFLRHHDRVVLISEPHYLWRVMRDLKHITASVKLKIAMRPIMEKGDWYDKNATQKRATSPTLFKFWEYTLMKLPWWLYVRVTKG